MNYNNQPIGFATGDKNPANTEAERIRRTTNNWMSTDAGRAWAKENTRFKDPDVREIIRLSTIESWKDPVYRESHSGDNHHTRKNAEEWSKFMSENNPMYDPVVVSKISDGLKVLGSLGLHPAQSEEGRVRASIAGHILCTTNNPMKRPEVAEKFKGPRPTGVCPFCNELMSIQGMKSKHIPKCSEKLGLDLDEARAKLDELFPNKKGRRN